MKTRDLTPDEIDELRSRLEKAKAIMEDFIAYLGTKITSNQPRTPKRKHP